jgi:CRISP-associated protein Cas1
MIKRTLYFGNPIYLHTAQEQLCWQIADTAQAINAIELQSDAPTIEQAMQATKPDDFLQGISLLHSQYTKPTNTKSHYAPATNNSKGSIPIEDIGVVILDHAQITISHALIAKLLANNVALITCNDTHHPTGLMLNLEGHSLQSQRWQAQIAASAPLKKQLWQHTVQCKLYNQAQLLATQGIEIGNMQRWQQEVKSGDSQNHEARAAVYYWKKIFATLPDFERGQDGLPPNNMLNYGYAILRAITARSLVGSGLLPTLGIFHSNQYNAYCLADDVMEPYRPIVDKLVLSIIAKYGFVTTLETHIKKELLQIPVLDVLIDGQTSPLMIAMQRTTASLVKCYQGTQRKILYPIQH